MIPVTHASPKTQDVSSLDALTGGAFSAPTSGERAAKLRTWLASDPATEVLQEVYRELSSRDKGAARVLRERLDEVKRARGQETIAAEWAGKAQALLDQPKLNLADALAWQRDAAKAGAPLSREPLAALKARLAERVKGIEDLQHRVQVQREAAVLLAQRIEVLSLKSWRDAIVAAQSLRADVPQWQAQAHVLTEDAGWPSIEARFPPLLDASRQQRQLVWDAFQSALAQATAAETDAAAPLPPVPKQLHGSCCGGGCGAACSSQDLRAVCARCAACVRGVLAGHACTTATRWCRPQPCSCARCLCRLLRRRRCGRTGRHC